jgi:hypothetical protein
MPQVVVVVSDGQAYSHAVQIFSQSSEDLVLGGCCGVGDFVGIGGVDLGRERCPLDSIAFFFSIFLFI